MKICHAILELGEDHCSICNLSRAHQPAARQREFGKVGEEGVADQ